MGLSRIAEHKYKSGIRFDFTVAPAVFGTSIRVPNVTVPSGCHPWLASGDFSFYSYRYDLEWKDKVYADVSFSKINDEATLVRTEIVNNSDIIQNCLINFFSSIEYPYEYYTRLVTPSKCVYKDALDYEEYGFDRNWEESGGYSILAETTEDVESIKQYIDFDTHPPEWVTTISYTGITSSLFILNNDFSILVYMPKEILPQSLLTELEE